MRWADEPDAGRTRANLPICSGGCSYGGRIDGLLYPAPHHLRLSSRLGGAVLAMIATSGIRIWRTEATHITLRREECTCTSRQLVDIEHLRWNWHCEVTMKKNLEEPNLEDLLDHRQSSSVGPLVYDALHGRYHPSITHN